ncbi:D-alanine--D-alanine ligase [soil metagenome]
MIKKILYRPFFIKLFNWEYWPFHIVYTPIYFYWLWLGIRARSFFFFSTSNPTIKNAGFLLESKKEIYDLIPGAYYPATLFFKSNSLLTDVIKAIGQSGLQYPVIAKPDIGMQGLAVKKIGSDEELIAYISASKVDFLVQEFIPYENEVGIFYYRYPNEVHGKISGIVQKEFLAVTGDGVSTIETLLQQDKRFILQLEILKRTIGSGFNKIPLAGEKCVLVPYGNHVRGAKFLDASNMIDEELTTAIDAACRQIDGFYFGRLDIRYKNWEELRQGKNFSIIELNGAGSEPTHMYDPKNSIFFAWREIIRHLNILARISKMNHKQRGISYMSLADGLQMIRENNKYVKLLK